LTALKSLIKQLLNTFLIYFFKILHFFGTRDFISPTRLDKSHAITGYFYVVCQSKITLCQNPASISILPDPGRGKLLFPGARIFTFIA
jgi:hypothetical protein